MSFSVRSMWCGRARTFVAELDRLRLHDALAVGRDAAVDQRLVEQRHRRRAMATPPPPGTPAARTAGLVEVEDRLRRHLAPAAGRLDGLASCTRTSATRCCCSSGQPMYSSSRPIGPVMRSRMNVLVVGAAAPVDDLGQHPVHRRGVVLVPAVDGPVEPPARERFEQRCAVGPVLRRERREREAAGVQHQRLDVDRVFAVRAELRDDVRHPLVEPQLAVLEQQPDGRRDDGLGATRRSGTACRPWRASRRRPARRCRRCASRRACRGGRRPPARSAACRRRRRASRGRTPSPASRCRCPDLPAVRPRNACRSSHLNSSSASAGSLPASYHSSAERPLDSSGFGPHRPGDGRPGAPDTLKTTEERRPDELRRPPAAAPPVHHRS